MSSVTDEDITRLCGLDPRTGSTRRILASMKVCHTPAFTADDTDSLQAEAMAMAPALIDSTAVPSSQRNEQAHTRVSPAEIHESVMSVAVRQMMENAQAETRHLYRKACVEDGECWLVRVLLWRAVLYGPAVV